MLSAKRPNNKKKKCTEIGMMKPEIDVVIEVIVCVFLLRNRDSGRATAIFYVVISSFFLFFLILFRPLRNCLTCRCLRLSVRALIRFAK